jgi:hypothetical protein
MRQYSRGMIGLLLVVFLTMASLHPHQVTAQEPSSNDRAVSPQHFQAIQQQVRTAVEQRQEAGHSTPAATRLPESHQSLNQSLEFDQGPKPSDAPDAVLHSWLGGRIVIHRRQGNLYLKLHL